MYSVEDLLISHGYKLPQHSSSSSSSATPNPAPPSRQAPSPMPPSYNKHHETLENRSGHRTVNGYEREPMGSYGTGDGGARQASRAGCSNNNEEPRDRGPPRREGDSRSQGDTHSLGESLTSDSGFCDGPRGQHSQSKDVSYWRRRGQDFTVLLDYADFREPHAAGQGGFGRPEVPQQPRGQEVSTDERQRAAQERHRWAAQAQARSREREAALHQWRMAAERKCQSLGTDEWRPAVNFGRQLSESEGERWAQEQQRLHARTPDGMVVHPRTKAKSQSLPRMLQPDNLQYVDMTSSGQELYRRVNGHPPSPHDFYRSPRWPENGRPASANQLSMTPKPRFTRPPRPPSYEVHQQIRGSCEVLSGRDSAVPQARDRTPLPLSRTGDPHLDFFAQDSGPPGYIPPPSYKRAPIMRGSCRGYGEIPLDYRYRGDVYQQMQMAPDGSHWFTRHPAGSWPDPQRERSIPSQKQLYPVYTTQERPGGGVQYIPFDDPRVRHISSALGGNSLTDADKIRHIRKELPSVTVSEAASDDSAFLPPPLGPFVAAKPTDDANQTSPSNFDNDNNRWHSNLHKETVDNFPATDQNCNNRYPKNQRPPPSPSSAFQAPVTTSSSSRQGSSSDQGFAETITQVKKIVPDSGPENNRNSKRRVSETIFCLVSVPIHTPTNINKDSAADQNNNETIPSLTVTNTDSVTIRHTENQNLRSKSMTEMPIRPHHSHFHTSSTSSMRNYKRAPLRKEIIDAWALQASEDKELCYAGSWPGNQYRNQETQTNSPLTVVKSPDPQSPPGGQEPGQSASDTTTDSGVGTDNNPSYGYPMAGQKNLHPSSNSAFSRLSVSPAQPPSPQPSQQAPSSPSKEERDQADQQPSSPRKSGSNPPDGEEQVAFGQFLLKPVNRRPWDAIGELECFNKELQDTINKRPNVDKCSEDLDEVHENILELSKLDQSQNAGHLTTAPDPGREAISLPLIHIDKPNNMRTRSESWGPTTDPDYREVRSAFSKPQSRSKTRPTKDELSTLPEPSPRDYGLLSSLTSHADPNQVYRQDIPVPQESLLRDVGLTVYTETPGGPGEPTQRSLSVPSPLDHQELNQSVQLSWESRTVLIKNNGSSEHDSSKEAEPERKARAENFRRARSENGRSPKGEGSPHITRLTREASFVFEEDEVDKRYTIPEPLSYRNESTMADKHLENLLIQEKANALPAEDLSNLYEVKCAKGIPENESIEQRAARILGIAVPVEALGVADRHPEDQQEDPDITTTTPTSEDMNAFPAEIERHSPDRETQQVPEQCEQVKEESPIGQGQETEEDKKTGSGVDRSEGEDVQKPSNGHSDSRGNHNSENQQSTVLDLPEFPPSKLPLSLPVASNEKLALSMCTGEKKGRGAASKLIESLQDKLSSSASSSATSSCRSATERMARLKELDSVSRIRRLSLKSSDSGGEAETGEEGDGGTEESGGQAETERDIMHKQEEHEEKRSEEICDKRTEHEEEENEEVYNEGEQRKEEHTEVELKINEEEMNEEMMEEMNEEIALKAEDEEGREVGVELKTEEAEAELKIEEDSEPSPTEEERGEGNAPQVSRADVTKEAEREEPPRPKQRTRRQKPPLLPKPHSVPKREITLPLSFSSVTCGSTGLEDEDMLSVSDSYDPSRVERV
ncbi:junctional cadherin 5-associated protein isoform 1-T2 [Polymixia lowei]